MSNPSPLLPTNPKRRIYRRYKGRSESKSPKTVSHNNRYRNTILICTATAIPFLGIARPQPQFERFIYSQDQSTFPPAEQADPSWEIGIYNSLTDTWIWKLGLRPRSFFSVNICFKFSAFCICSVPVFPPGQIHTVHPRFGILLLVTPSKYNSLPLKSLFFHLRFHCHTLSVCPLGLTRNNFCFSRKCKKKVLNQAECGEI
jgi:hypothetical protein